jgi:hypothetical protein
MTKKIGTIIVLIAALAIIGWGIRKLVSPKVAGGASSAITK